ncbi:MAG: hypothetical protein QM582_16705 [Micropruina sp.]|uniref:hypothetical protein n=1 Tax=Micropruina sp. TaxID=2737536 RepID=UPI0039E654E0
MVDDAVDHRGGDGLVAEDAAPARERHHDLSYDAAEQRFMTENRSTSLIARLIRPAEIANLVSFVTGAGSSAINGSVLRSDGGIVRSVSAATRNCPVTATKVPAGGHETCPVVVTGSART